MDHVKEESEEIKEMESQISLSFDSDLIRFERVSKRILVLLDRMKVDSRFWYFFEDKGINKHNIFEAWMALEKLHKAFEDRPSSTMPQ